MSKHTKDHHSQEAPQTEPLVQEKIVRIQENFKKICLFYKLPLSYCTSFLKYLSTLPFDSQQEEYRTKMYAISDQTNLIKQGQSFAQNMSAILKERQKMVKHLRTDLISTRNPKSINLGLCIQKLQSIRMFSLSVLQQLEVLGKKYKSTDASYFWQNIDRISRDIDFLRFSYLRRFLQFSSNHDPLFLVPLKKFQNLETTINYNRRPIVQFLAIDKPYKQRLMDADSFAKAISITFNFENSQENTQLHRFSTLPTDKQEVYEGTKASNLPQINTNKKSLPASYHFHTHQQQKSLVVGVLRQIIDDYHHKSHQRDPDPYKNSKATAKVRCNTQSVNRSDRNEYYPLLKEQVMKKYDKYHIRYRDESQETQKIKSKSSKNKKVIYIKTFAEDDADISKNDQSDMSKNSKNVQNNSINTNKKSDKMSQKQSKSVSHKDNISTASKQQKKSVNRYKLPESHVQLQYTNTNVEEQAPISEASIGKSKIKYKMNRLRNNKIVSRNMNKNTLQETITSEEDIVKKKEEIHNRETANKGSSKNKPQMGISTYFSIPINYEKNTRQFLQEEVIKNKQNFKEQFQSPLDRVSEIRQYFENSSSRQQIKVPKKIIQPEQKQQKQEIHNSSSSPIYNIKQLAQWKKKQEKAEDRILQKQKPSEHTSVKSNQTSSFIGKIVRVSPEKKVSSYRQAFQHKKIVHSKQKMDEDKGSMKYKTVDPSVNKKKNQKKVEEKLIKKNNEVKKEPSKKVIHELSISQTPSSMYDPRSQNIKEDFKQGQQILDERINQPYVIVEKKQEEPKKVLEQPNRGEQKLEKEEQSNKIQEGSPKIEDKPIEVQQQPKKIEDPPKVEEVPRKEESKKEKEYKKNEEDKKEDVKEKKEDNIENLEQKVVEKQQSEKAQQNKVPKQEKAVPKQQQKLELNQPQPQPQTKLPEPESKPQEQKQPQIVNKPIPEPKVETGPQPIQQKPSQQLTKQALNNLNRCVFSPKTLKSQQLKSIIQKLTSHHQYLSYFLSTQYMQNRHTKILYLTIDSQKVAFCLYHPRITEQQRQLIVLFFQITKQEYKIIQKNILDIFVNYFFINDPCNKLYFVKHKSISNYKFVNNAFKIKAPFSTPLTRDTWIVFPRKEVKCKNQEQFTTIFNTCHMLTTTQELQVEEFNSKSINISKQYLVRANAKLKGGQTFKHQKELDLFVGEEGLPSMYPKDFNKKINFAYSIWEDCLLNTRFFVYSKTFYITIEPPYTFLYESQYAYYLMIATTSPNRYFLLADQLYEEDKIDLFKDFKQNVLNKKVKDIFMNPSFNNKIVTCPQFFKAQQAQLSPNSSTVVQFEMNWKEYMKGVRYLDQSLTHLELATPFFCAMVNTDEQELLQYQYTLIVEEKDIIKS